jgi:diguanylate cyclase (GGDEF)-like protein
LERQEQLAQTVARQLALAMSNLRLRERLQRQAIRDPLTGLFNRRYLDETLEREIQRAARLNHGVGVIVVDLDHFKHFNDTYGHDGGDALLRSVGRLLQDNIRTDDVACRYGGEEFVLVFPMICLKSLIARAQEIRGYIRQLSVEHHGQHLAPVTASFGVALSPDHGNTADSIVKAADAALYEAKRSGRDRVVVASRGGWECK